jgi:hypothetical protein
MQGLNTPNGSWGIVQVQPTTQTIEQLGAPRIQLSFLVQVNSRRVRIKESQLVGPELSPNCRWGISRYFT